MIDWAEYTKLLVALLAVTDVPGAIPVFLQRTGGLRPAEQRLAAVSAGIFTAAILLLFVFFGELVLEAFSITIEAFKIIGGLIILLMALQMLGLIPEAEESGEALQKHPITMGLVPFAVPLFAGPGTISLIMVYAHLDPHPGHDAIVAALVVTVALAIIFGLGAATALGRFLGPLSLQILSRLLGILVGALGIEFILEGIAVFFAQH